MRASHAVFIACMLLGAATTFAQERLNNEQTDLSAAMLTSNFITAEAASADIALGQAGAECCPPCHSCERPLQQAPCVHCPHVSTLLPYYNVSLFGALQGNMLFNTARSVAPGVPFLLAPAAAPGLAENTIDVHARSSSLGAAVTGPEMGSLKAGGLLMVIFYNDNIIADRYGILPLQAYGDLKNEDWRFAAGLQFDVFNPNLPTMLVFSALAASGNSGNNFRGQFRVERFLHPSADSQWTLQAALSEPIATSISDSLRLNEDNGWPNVEGRIMYGRGTPEQVGLEVRRPFEVGVSGIVGQVRTTQIPAAQFIADVWGLGADLRWKINDRCGVVGEFFVGQGLGTYNAGILQTTNSSGNFNAVRTHGAFGEFWYYWNPCLHSHIGYGFDDPVDGDTVGPVRNETYFANLLWDANQSLRIGFELTWRETEYLAPLQSNQGAGFHTQVQWAF